MKTHRATRVLRGDRRGSSWPVVVETDDGLLYAKLRGAAQGPAALVAEIVVAELAEALGLHVPARSWIWLDDGVPREDRHAELADLLRASCGWNLGFRPLEGAQDLRLDDVGRVDMDEASKILWLDGLVMNVDRTPRNPNLLAWQGGLWLIDHGAALGFHHDWRAVTEDSPRSDAFTRTPHVLRERATRIFEWDEKLAEC